MLEDRHCPSGTPLFQDALSYPGLGPFPAGSVVSGIAVGDFTGDGKLDLAEAIGGQRGINVVPGNGDGTFQSQVITSGDVSYNPGALAAADFNGDGKLDLVAINPAADSAGTVGVMYGNGDGTFASALPLTGGPLPYGIVVGDFNGDNKPDFATANYGAPNITPGSVSVFLNRGNGTFRVVNDPLDGASNPVGIAAGDLNGDGKLDLAVANFGTINGNPGGAASMSVLLGNGDGTFQAPARSPLFGGYTAGFGGIALGDVNGDHHPDIVVDGGGTSSVTANSVFLGNGDGTFQAARSFTTTGSDQAVAVTDLSGDGKADIAVANRSDGLQVLLSNGDGTFQAPVTSTVNSEEGVAGLVVVDFTGNGRPDLIVSNDSGTFDFLPNRGDGTFLPETDLPGPPDFYFVIWSLASADLNGDGIPDLAIASYDASYKERGAILQVFFGKGDGTFAAPVTSSLTFVFSQMTFADLNHDGIPDLIGILAPERTAGGEIGSAVVMLGNGDGTFDPIFVPPSGGWERAVVGDFNGDGSPDLAFNDSYAGDVRVFLGNGDGTFRTGGSFAGAGRGLVAADFNGDGKLDLAAGFADGVNVLLGNGDGTFRPAVTYPGNGTDGVGNYELAAGDFNRDGVPDLVTGNLSLLLGNGDGTFRDGTPPSVAGEAGNQYEPILVADVNRDGTPDLLQEQPYEGGLRVLLGNGDASFQAPQYYALPGGDTDLVADLTGDGKPDFLHAWESSHLSLLTNVAPAFGQFAFDSSAYAVDENAGSVTITVKRTGALGGTATVHYATGGGSATAGTSYTATAGDLTFQPGESTRTFTIPVLDDHVYTGDGTVNLTLSDPTGVNTLGLPYTAVLTIHETDPARQAPTITSAGATAFTAGSAGSFTVTASGVPAPALSESAGDTLPQGVAFDPATGVLGGTPALGSGGTYPLHFAARNGVSPDAGQTFTLTVDEAPALTSAGAATFTTGGVASFTVATRGFPAPALSESASDILPRGVTFNAATGVLSGTPAAGTAGTYTLHFTAANGIGPEASQTFTLTVAQAVHPTTTAVNVSTSAATPGQPVTITVTVRSADGSTPTGPVRLTGLPGAPVTVTLRGGVATYTTALPLGRFVITPSYGGDTCFRPSRSTSAAVTVQAAPLELDPKQKGKSDLVIGATTGTYVVTLTKLGTQRLQVVITQTRGGHAHARAIVPLKALAKVLIYGQKGRATIRRGHGVRVPVVFVKPVAVKHKAPVPPPVHHDALDAALAEWR